MTSIFDLTELLTVTQRSITSLLEPFSVSQFVIEPTHQLGGLLDVVITGPDNTPQDLSVVDVGLSDHMFVTWSAKLRSPVPKYETASRRLWKN